MGSERVGVAVTQELVARQPEVKLTVGFGWFVAGWEWGWLGKSWGWVGGGWEWL